MTRIKFTYSGISICLLPCICAERYYEVRVLNEKSTACMPTIQCHDNIIGKPGGSPAWILIDGQGFRGYYLNVSMHIPAPIRCDSAGIIWLRYAGKPSMAI